MMALVAGWFSFEKMGATAGDLLARDLVCGWLEEAGWAYEIAHAPPFDGGVDWRSVDPGRYTDLVFVCGPMARGQPLTDFLARFEGRRLIGINLSMLEPLEAWNPFDALWERDSSAAARPDVTFMTDTPRAPVVGVVRVDRQGEYQGRGLHSAVNAAIKSFVASRDIAAVEIDTRLDTNNRTGLTTPGQVEALIARMDAVITTRLHGMVFALKHGVPVVAIDPISGGAKVRRQAETIGWRTVLGTEDVTPESLSRAFDFCLTPQAKFEATRCGRAALQALAPLGEEFKNGLIAGAPGM